MNSLTREQKRYAIVGAYAVFIIMLFLNWFGSGGFNRKGLDTLPSGWLWLLAAAFVGIVYAADVFNFDLPAFVGKGPATAVSFAIFFLMVTLVLESTDGLKFGFWIALLASIVGFAGVVLTRNET